MSIGLFDCDFATYGFSSTFNLELMKLSSYFKKRKEIVLLTPHLHPDRYQQFFLRKDIDDRNFPSFSLTDAVRCGGLAYSGGKYSPLPMSIEKQKPDLLLYGAFEKFVEEKEQILFRVLSRAEHLRLSLDGEKIWSEYEVQLQSQTKPRLFFFYDHNLTQIQGSAAEVRRLQGTGRKDCRYGCKFPIIADKEEVLMEWLSMKPHYGLTTFKFTGEFTNDGLLKYARTKLPHLDQKIQYVVTAVSSSEEDFVKNRIRKIYHEAIILRRFGQKILLTYEDNFFKDRRWEKVIQLMNLIIIADHKKIKGEEGVDSRDYDTLQRILRCSIPFLRRGLIKEKPQIKEIFMFVKDNYYPLFKDFYECTAKSLKEEYQINDW